MVKSLTYYLSVLLLSISIYSCTQESDIIYTKEFSSDERTALAESLINGAGTDLYYQGAVGERMIILEGMKYDPTSAWGWRELGVPYLKRGMAAEAEKYYAKAVESDAKEWQGYKAYCWLYFYRDYEKALHDAQGCDALTPSFVDYPQATSVDYMSGLSYLGLGKIDSAIHYLQKHLDYEIQTTGIEYVEAPDFLNLVLAYAQNNQLDKAQSLLEEAIKHNDTTADLYYHLAKILLQKGNKKEAIRNLDQAEYWIKEDSKNKRSYVEEFNAVYIEDVEQLRKEMQ